MARCLHLQSLQGNVDAPQKELIVSQRPVHDHEQPREGTEQTEPARKRAKLTVVEEREQSCAEGVLPQEFRCNASEACSASSQRGSETACVAQVRPQYINSNVKICFMYS